LPREGCNCSINAPLGGQPCRRSKKKPASFCARKRDTDSHAVRMDYSTLSKQTRRMRRRIAHADGARRREIMAHVFAACLICARKRSHYTTSNVCTTALKVHCTVWNEPSGRQKQTSNERKYLCIEPNSAYPHQNQKHLFRKRLMLLMYGHALTVCNAGGVLTHGEKKKKTKNVERTQTGKHTRSHTLIH
jgi:galactose mutarotase-like enzyme